MVLELLIVLGGLSLIASPAMAYQALRRVRRLENEFHGLKRLPEEPHERGESEGKETPTPWHPTPTASPPAPRETVPSPAPDAPAAASSPGAGDSPRTVRRRSIEENVASRWLVWLGSLTIGLGGIFLVKYGIDNDILSPAVRVGLGALLGIALTIGGEWLRRSPIRHAIARGTEDFVPPALTAAGIATTYGSLYAGYALYGLLAPLVAFAGLGGAAMLALALSLVQGPFVAAIGILGAFGVPILVQATDPSAWALFPYLLFVAAGAMAIVRFRNWPWLAWSTLLISAFWDVAWMAGSWHAGDAPAVGLHMILLLAMFLAVRVEMILQRRDDARRSNDIVVFLNTPQALVLGASIVSAIVVFCLVRVDLYGAASLAVAGTVIAMFLGCAFRLRLESLLPLAAVTAVAILAAWHLPIILGYRLETTGVESQIRTATAPVVPPEMATFAAIALATAVLFAAAGFAGLWRARRPGLWSAVSAAVPLAVYAVAYWRMRDAEVYLAWGAIGLALSVIACLAAGHVNRFRDRPGFEAAIGSYALATIGAIGLTAAILLDETWLTIAMALQLPALAWVDGRLRIPALRAAAILLAGIVGVRLVFLHFLPGIPLLIRMDGWWLLYSYGIPALSFGLAARWFHPTADGRLIELLHALSVGTAVALCSMEIRYLIGDGTLGFGRYSLLEQSLHSIAWLVSGYGLYRRNRTVPRPTAEWGAKILIGLATAQIVLLQAAASNPVLAHEDVGPLPVFGVISLAYGIPAMLAWLVHDEARRQHHPQVSRIAAILGVALAFLDITLEIRHVFHGRFLDGGGIGDAEGYAYSLIWLVCAAVLLGLGIWRRSIVLRHAALGIILLAVAKVFLWDMAWLTGLYRVASFLGLGLSLVAVGYLYQRLIITPSEKDVPG